MNNFPGNLLIESLKVDFITILDTHGAIPWRDSMDLGHSMNKFPGNFLIESPKVDFITILDTHGGIPWSDSMDLVYSMEKFPGNFSIESKLDRVILSTNFQDLFS